MDAEAVFRVTSPYFTAAIVVDNKTLLVKEAAPVVGWMKNKHIK